MSLAFILTISIFAFLHFIGVILFAFYRKLAIRSFTIHKLTDKNKIALEQLGFKYGSFVSRQNINYRGYRYGRGTIIVLPNGRVNYIHKKLLNAKENAIVDIVANLPKE